MTEAANTSDFLPPEGKKIDSRLLRQIITDSLSDGELRILCHDLGWRFEFLAGETFPERVLSLVEQFERRQRLNVLYMEVRKLRPEYNWAAIYIDISPEDENGDNLPGPRRQQGDGVGETTLILSKGIIALMKLMRSPEVGDAVVQFQTDFKAASDQIDRLNDYKLLHDLFQDLEYHYALINTQQVRLPDDVLAWDAIITSEPELRNKISDLVESATRALFAEVGERWLAQLQEARDAIREGVEAEDDVVLKKAMRQIYQTLSRQPTRLNTHLVATADSLRLDTLERALHTIYGRISQTEVGTADELVQELKAGTAALTGLEGRVKGLVREHKAWQYVDDELRRLEGVGLGELAIIWEDLQDATLEAMGSSQEEWAVLFQELLQNLNSAVNAEDNMTIRKLHRRFRTQANRRFRRVDASLLALCQDLQKVGESIDLLLRNYK